MTEVLADSFLLFLGELGLCELGDNQVPKGVRVVVGDFSIEETLLEDFADRVRAGPEDRLDFTRVVVVDVLLPIFNNRLGKDGVIGREAFLPFKVLVPIKEVLHSLLVFNREEGRDDSLGELGFHSKLWILVYGQGARLKGFHRQTVNGRNTRSREQGEANQGAVSLVHFCLWVYGFNHLDDIFHRWNLAFVRLDGYACLLLGERQELDHRWVDFGLVMRLHGQPLEEEAKTTKDVVAVYEGKRFTFAIGAALEPVFEGSHLLLPEAHEVFVLMAFLPQKDGSIMSVYGVWGEAFDFFEVEEELPFHDLVLEGFFHGRKVIMANVVIWDIQTRVKRIT